MHRCRGLRNPALARKGEFAHALSETPAISNAAGADLIRDSGGQFNRAQDALLHPGETSVVTDVEALKESVGADLVRDAGAEFILDRYSLPLHPGTRTMP